MNAIFKNLCRGTISHVSIIRDNSSLRAVPGKISGALFVGDLKKVLKNLNTTIIHWILNQWIVIICR